jgi:hypothetical protein
LKYLTAAYGHRFYWVRSAQCFQTEIKFGRTVSPDEYPEVGDSIAE